MKKWSSEEVNYLKKNYPNTLNKNLSKELKRSLKAISYMAYKLKIKKDKDFYSKSRKHTPINFTKELISNFYLKEKKSTRKIAKELKVGKTTVEYYLKKFKIKRRTHSEANKVRFLTENTWTKGLTKENDFRIRKLSEKVKLAHKRKRERKIKKLEKEFGKPFKEIIDFLYWDKKLNQEQISKKLGFDRSIIISLMKELKIKKRPNYQYISSLKGKNHSLYGITWESLLGKEKALKRKKESAKRFKELTIRRLEKNEFPFFDTKIERMLARELIKRKIIFVKQFRILNKFVCDFAIPHLKIVVECDGDYWHANPRIYDKNKLTFTQKKTLKRDLNKNKELIQKEWVVLRFFESDIKEDVKKCVDKIEKEIKKKIQQIKKIKSPLDVI